jgi:hypothetical protein
VALVKIGVVKVPPAVPAVPVFEPYQTTFPAVHEAVKFTENPEQTEFGDAVGAATAGFTETSTCVRGLTQVGEAPLSQAAK